MLLRAWRSSAFVRFLAVGVLNTAFGYACFAALVWAGLPPPLALLLATVAGVLFNHLTVGTFVFRAQGRATLWRFAAVYGVIYAANVGLLALLQRAGIGPLAGQALLVLPVAVASFLLNRALVFAAPGATR